MSWEAAKLAVDLLQWIATIAVGLYAWWSTRTRATSRALRGLEERLNRMDRRIDSADSAIANGPGHADMQSLRDNVATLSGDVKELTGTVRGMTRAVDLMSEHLLNRKQGG